MKQLLSRHPKGLPYLFLTELWERYGFYVVQGMLILYMTKEFGFSDNKSYLILGTFSAFVYIAPLLGGILADRLIGFKQAIIWGGIFLSIGYGFLAIATVKNFYYALAIIIVGNGLFKPNISGLLGALYRLNDSTRDVGFTIFYVGINLGILLAGFSSGFVKNHYGWHVAFALPCIGLVFGLMTFFVGIKRGYLTTTHLSTPSQKWFFKKPYLIIYCMMAIPLLVLLMQENFLNKWLLPLLGIFLLFFVFIQAYQQKEIQNRNALLTLNILIISSIVFWMIMLQIFFSVNLFVDRMVDKHWLGIEVPTTVFYSLESAFIIIVGPILAWVWNRLSEKNKNPSYFLKFFFAMLCLGLCFFILFISTYFTDANHTINLWWIVLAYFVATVGEILLSPIGLAAVTVLSPLHLTGMMMGIWFVALGFGGAFAGWLATFASIPDSMQEMGLQMAVYRHAFFLYTGIAFIVAAILFVVQILAKKHLNQPKLKKCII